MPTVHLIRGPTGAGKTTFAEGWRRSVERRTD